MGLHRPQPAVAAVPSTPYLDGGPTIPGLAEALLARDEARECVNTNKRQVASLEAALATAQAEREQITARTKRAGVVTQQDVDAAARADADIALPARIAMQRAALRDAEADEEAAEHKVSAAKRKELERRAPRLHAASDAVRTRGKEEYDAALAECNRLARLYNDALKPTDATLDATLAATAEFAAS